MALNVDNAIHSCKIGVIVTGRSWIGSRLADNTDVLRAEISQLLSSQKVIVHVLINEARLPENDQLPPDLRPPRDHQARMIDDAGWETGVAELIRAMERSLKLIRNA